MNLNLILGIVSSILFIWLVVLTIMYVAAVRHYKSLTIGDGDNLEKVITTVFKGLETLHTEFTTTQDRVSTIEQKNIKHIQKVALKRFNPFGDTGGNQSFSVALLDANNDGVVFSSLHGRSGTRVYSKPIVSGKQGDYELSEEEVDVIDLAIKEENKNNG